MPIGNTRITSKDPLDARIAAQKCATLTRAQNILNYLTIQYQTSWNEVWANPLGLTPQQVCDSWGTDAAALITGAAYIASACVAGYTNQGQTPEQIALIIKPALKTLTPNNDGTVTVGA